MLAETVSLKLGLLCEGVSLSKKLLEHFQTRTEYIEKRRAYGTGDSIILNSTSRTPQEIILDGQIIAAANYNPESNYCISLEENIPVLKHRDKTVKITFPSRPKSYGCLLYTSPSPRD